MAENRVQIDIRAATRDAVAAIDSLRQALGDLRSGMNPVDDGARRASSGIGSLTASVRESAAGIKECIGQFAGLVAAWQVADLVRDSAMLAARVESLGRVMGVVGNNAGYTAAEMDQYARSVASMGITTEESRQTIIRMAQAQLDLSQASALARVAQDAAVIAGMNSSDALQGILHGITTLQPEVLRTYGIIVNFEDEYRRFALSVGRTVESISSHEKQQIALNAVLDRARMIQGAYEAAMDTAGKQMTSLKRITDELKLALGEAFTPALGVGVSELTRTLQGMGQWFKDHPQTVREWASAMVSAVYSVKAEFLRLAMLVDKAGGTLTAGAMLLYGPGKALGVESSTRRFDAMAQANMLFEARYAEKDAELQRMAADLNTILDRMGNTPAADQGESSRVALARAENARRAKEEQARIARAANAKIVSQQEKARAALIAENAALSQSDPYLRELARLDSWLEEEKKKLSASKEDKLLLEKNYWLKVDDIMRKSSEEQRREEDRQAREDERAWDEAVRLRERMISDAYERRKSDREFQAEVDRVYQIYYGSVFEGAGKGLKEWLDQTKTVFQQGVELARSTAQAMQGAFSDFFFDMMTGKLKSLGSYIRSFAYSMARTLSNIMAENAVRSTLGSSLLPGLVGGVARAFPGAASWFSGAPVPGSPDYVGPMPQFHAGGYVPRFHFGGLAPDEVPAILQSGEGVLSRKGMAALDALNAGGAVGGSRVEVNIINQSGMPLAAQVSAPRFSQAKQIIDIVVDDYLRGGLTRTVLAR